MEMENILITKKHKLEISDILKEALMIFSKNTNFLIFTLFATLPLFFFSVYYENFLETTIVEAIAILRVPSDDGYFNSDRSSLEHIIQQLHQKLSHKLIQLFLLFVVPLHLLDLSTMLVIVNLASKIYVEGRSLTIKEMAPLPIRHETLRNAFITSIYAAYLRICTILGFVWLLTNYCIFWSNIDYSAFFARIFGVAFVLLLAKYLEWSAWWNLSILASILEEKVYGAEAFAVAAIFGRGNERRGCLLTLIFFGWQLLLRLPCMATRCYEEGRETLVQLVLFCIGNAVKWVAFLVYFYDCKRQKLEKIVNEQV